MLQVIKNAACLRNAIQNIVEMIRTSGVQMGGFIAFKDCQAMHA